MSGSDLDKAFALLKTIRAYKNSRFPFLRTRVDYDLLLYIGHGQVSGKPMNLTDILTSNIGTVSTIVRRLGRLEKLGVVHKLKATTDKRNVHYFLADEHLDAVAEFVDYLSRAGRPEGAARGPVAIL
jgi:DNA-binding MarR family transcriptional regulator